MAPLLTLIGSFLVLVIANIIDPLHRIEVKMAGRISLSLMLVVTGVSHFIMTEGMMLMLPDFIPFKKGIIYLTGVLELMAAFGIQTKLKRFTGILLIAFFISVLPANIFASIHHVSIPNADYSGPGLSYLWFRIPLQLLFIGWTWFFTVRTNRENQ